MEIFKSGIFVRDFGKRLEDQEVKLQNSGIHVTMLFV